LAFRPPMCGLGVPPAVARRWVSEPRFFVRGARPRRLPADPRGAGRDRSPHGRLMAYVRRTPFPERLSGGCTVGSEPPVSCPGEPRRYRARGFRSCRARLPKRSISRAHR
jgi:hypothetical protein